MRRAALGMFGMLVGAGCIAGPEEPSTTTVFGDVSATATFDPASGSITSVLTDREGKPLVTVEWGLDSGLVTGADPHGARRRLRLGDGVTNFSPSLEQLNDIAHEQWLHEETGGCTCRSWERQCTGIWVCVPSTQCFVMLDCGPDGPCTEEEHCEVVPNCQWVDQCNSVCTIWSCPV